LGKKNHEVNENKTNLDDESLFSSQSRSGNHIDESQHSSHANTNEVTDVVEHGSGQQETTTEQFRELNQASLQHAAVTRLPNVSITIQGCPPHPPHLQLFGDRMMPWEKYDTLERKRAAR
jgi:hypothetical protein